MPRNRDRAFARALGGRLRAARGARELTTGDVAAQLGVSYQMVQKYESGHTVPFADTLMALARIVGVSAAHLLGETDGVHDRKRGPVEYRG